MDELLDQARNLWEGEIDFQGQSLADTLTTTLLSVTGIIAFLLGFATHNILYALYIGLGGTALTFLVVVPPWPFYNQHPLKWLPAKHAPARSAPGGGVDLRGVDLVVDGRRVG